MSHKESQEGKGANPHTGPACKKENHTRREEFPLSCGGPPLLGLHGRPRREELALLSY